MADDRFIGLGLCPYCKQPEARFTLSKSDLVVMTCRQRRCGVQAFSRTGDADESMRALISTASPDVAIPPAPPPADPPPPPAPTSKADPLPDDDVIPPAPVKKKTPGWGILGAING